MGRINTLILFAAWTLSTAVCTGQLMHPVGYERGMRFYFPLDSTNELCYSSNLTVAGSATFTTSNSMRGGAWSCSDYNGLRVPGSGVVSEITISFWVNWRSFNNKSALPGYVHSYDWQPGSYPTMAGIRDEDPGGSPPDNLVMIQSIFERYNAGPYLYQQRYAKTGEWHHVAHVYRRATCNDSGPDLPEYCGGFAFFDGVMRGVWPMVNDPAGVQAMMPLIQQWYHGYFYYWRDYMQITNFFIGNTERFRTDVTYHGGAWPDAYIDEVQIYHKALLPHEIKALAVGSLSKTPLPREIPDRYNYSDQKLTISGVQ